MEPGAGAVGRAYRQASPASGRWQALRCNWAIESQTGRREREQPRPPPLGVPAPPSPGASQSYQALLRGGRPPPPGRPSLSSSLSNLPAGAVPLAGGWAPDSVLETHLWGQSRGSGLALYPTRYFHPHRGAPGPTGPRGGRPGLRRSSLRLPQGPPPQGPAPGMGWPRPGSSMPRGRDHAARLATVCVVRTCPGGVCRCKVTEESGLGVPSR